MTCLVVFCSAYNHPIFKAYNQIATQRNTTEHEFVSQSCHKLKTEINFSVPV